uniref:Uncharacterized protein n=1 Tax=Branchiostoma floridae TaxID=7739 RepID=C3YJ35_BRAFL|eukprot:XP_002603686.1 hypothetical protein BRAFLDRAFT_126905 [Branchiostoma floridae]
MKECWQAVGRHFLLISLCTFLPVPSSQEAASLIHQKGSFNPELARLKFDNKEASPNTALEAAQLVSQRGTFNPRAVFEQESSSVAPPARPSGAPPQKLKHSWGQSLSVDQA